MRVSGGLVHCARRPPRSASLGGGTAAAQLGPPLNDELSSGLAELGGRPQVP